jgi:hypothetical protein
MLSGGAWNYYRGAGADVEREIPTRRICLRKTDFPQLSGIVIQIQRSGKLLRNLNISQGLHSDVRSGTRRGIVTGASRLGMPLAANLLYIIGVC